MRIYLDGWILTLENGDTFYNLRITGGLIVLAATLVLSLLLILWFCFRKPGNH